MGRQHTSIDTVGQFCMYTCYILRTLTYNLENRVIFGLERIPTLTYKVYASYKYVLVQVRIESYKIHAKEYLCIHYTIYHYI